MAITFARPKVESIKAAIFHCGTALWLDLPFLFFCADLLFQQKFLVLMLAVWDDLGGRWLSWRNSCAKRRFSKAGRQYSLVRRQESN